MNELDFVTSSYFKRDYANKIDYNSRRLEKIYYLLIKDIWRRINGIDMDAGETVPTVIEKMLVIQLGRAMFLSEIYDHPAYLSKAKWYDPKEATCYDCSDELCILPLGVLESGEDHSGVMLINCGHVFGKSCIENHRNLLEQRDAAPFCIKYKKHVVREVDIHRLDGINVGYWDVPKWMAMLLRIRHPDESQVAEVGGAGQD